jgi:CubicO group peptidase (beta-lactamase class C family)
MRCRTIAKAIASRSLKDSLGKALFLTCRSFVLCILLANATGHAIPWVERHGMSGTTFQSEFDLWTAPPYSLRLTQISGSESSGQGRYAAIFEKNNKTTAWAAHHGMTAADFNSTHNQLHGDGYRLIWLDGFGVGTTAYYNGIWERTLGPVQRVRLGESLASHQSANSANIADGYGLVDVCAFSVDGTPLHAGVWVQGVRLAVQVRYNLTSAQYQTEFNAMGADGYHIWRVSGFESGTAERFTGVWRTTSVGEGWAYHGMRAADFNAHNLNAQTLGYRPVFADAYNLGADTFYNATWIRNGGLSTSRLSAIATAVQNYMSARNLPGLSLAIAREGRLVYARGFGYADTSDGEVAHSQHRWRLASVSKTICAVSALRALEDSATWSLGSQAFGSGALFGTDYGSLSYSTWEQQITLRQILNMTAGWNSQGKLWYDTEPSFGTDHAAIIGYQLDSVPLSWQPGTMDCYNNFNYQVAARIPEKISGQLFEVYTKDQVFDPCGITSMILGGRTAAERKLNEVAYYEGDQWGTPEAIHPARMDGSTGWIAKPSDLLLLSRRIDGDTRHKDIIGAYALSQMQLGNGLPSCGGGYSSYGMGWYPSTRNGKTWWQHNGAMAGTQAILIVSDDGSQAFAYACNSIHSTDWPSGLFRNTILDLMDVIDDVNAWPAIDLFGKYNPEYDTWAAAEFGAATTRIGLADFWSPEADPDDDGRNNALEAFLGSDPLTPNGPSWSTSYYSSGDLVLRWTRRLGNRGVEATADSSSQLFPWTGAPATIVNRTDLIAPIGYGIQEATVPIPRGAAQRFLRVNLSAP